MAITRSERARRQEAERAYKENFEAIFGAQREYSRQARGAAME